MNSKVTAPTVSIGGSLGASAGVGIDGNASVSIAAPNNSIPSMSLNVTAPNVSVGGSLGVGKIEKSSKTSCAPCSMTCAAP